jgi:hypothetical protein
MSPPIAVRVHIPASWLAPLLAAALVMAPAGCRDQPGAGDFAESDDGFAAETDAAGSAATAGPAATPAAATAGAASAAASDPEAPPRPGPSPIHRAWQTAKTDHARFIALAGNRDGHRHDVEVRYPRLFAELEVDKRVPTDFDADALRAAFAAHAEALGLSVRAFEATPRPADIPEDRAVPDRLGPDEPFQWLHDEIRREIDVAMQLSPPDLERLERWFDQRGRVGPMFLVEAVTVEGDAARVRLTAFHFVSGVKVPLREIPPFDADDVLKAHEVDPGADEGDPGSDDPRVAEIRSLYDEVNGRLDEINEALAHRSRADLWDVRNAFVHHTARRVEAQRWTDVLR